MIHNLKIEPRFFNDVAYGKKTFEIRNNDRDFHVDDILHLQEYSDGDYTGRAVFVKVRYLLDDPRFLKEGYVALGVRLIGKPQNYGLDEEEPREDKRSWKGLARRQKS